MTLDTSCPSLELLRRSLDLDDPMSDAERQRIEVHVDACQRGCKEAIAALLHGTGLALDLAATPAPPVTQPSSPPAPTALPPVVPGYEILGELGRGGMGVVYEARQRALNRTVALKMLLGGPHAGPEELLRFQVEAEAVAELQHPNIVQIYEVGTQDGLPYFALEYASGGSLAQKLQAGPLSSGDAARLTETLARAMQHAHEHAILHRDLKPANILLSSDGTPKITDFGLARRLQGGRSLTQSGVILGTPSYMAPEQAGGSTRQHTTAVDVYALGALLYELLTGRPPFQAATPLETMLQVVAEEPVPPSRLQPRVPRDLETICLKCLAKEPARRYESAQELADELRLYQEGQPIRARAAAWPERLAKWVKRRPAVAALAAAVVLVVVAGLATSLLLAGWAFHERDQARARLAEAQQADRRRVQAQVEQLGSAAPEAVPALLAALKEDREAVRPRLRELWTDQGGDRKRRMRAGLALLDDDPTVREPLADWMIEADDPREVLLVRGVLKRYGTDLADRLWSRASDKQFKVEARFRALVALAAFDPANPRWTKAGPTAVEQLLKANPLHLGPWMQALGPVRDHLQGMLGDVFRSKLPLLADYRHLAATVLAAYADDCPKLLADLACDADAKQFEVLQPVLEKNGKEVRAALTAELVWKPAAAETEADRITRARRQGHAAAALAALGEPDAAWPVLRHSRTADARTVLIHALAPRMTDARTLIRRLEKEPDASIRAALILALGEYTAAQLLPEERAVLTPKLLAWYRTDPDPGVHGAIDWLLRHSKSGPVSRPLDWGGRNDLEGIDADLAGKPGRAGQRWYVNRQNQTFVAIGGPVEFLMGSPDNETGRGEDETQHRRTIGRSFAVAAKPVMVAEWQTFLNAMTRANVAVGPYYVRRCAPDADCPILAVSWYDAAMYCRWLSELEDLRERDMVYPPLGDILRCADGQTPLKLPQDHLSRTGYRLPTGAEFEYACRAETATRWCFGEGEELLQCYAWSLLNSQNRSWPVGQKKPNDLGLFDVHGNAWAWCQESYRPYEAAPREDGEDDREVKDAITRVIRGGSCRYQAAMLRAAFREHDRPSYPGETIGLRLARTLPRDHFAALPPN